MPANVLIVPVGAEQPDEERPARRAQMRDAIAAKYDSLRETGTIIVDVRDLADGRLLVLGVSWEVNGIVMPVANPDVRKDVAVVLNALREAGYAVVDQTPRRG
jgi:hypothetical protein